MLFHGRHLNGSRRDALRRRQRYGKLSENLRESVDRRRLRLRVGAVINAAEVWPQGAFLFHVATMPAPALFGGLCQRHHVPADRAMFHG
jgi:hypothetical protein